MQIELKELPKSELELTITLAPDEYRKHLESAAAKIATEEKFEGFRSGKAPYELVRQKVGEGEIMNHALEKIIAASLLAAIKQKTLNTVGQPKISIKKMAPGNDFIYTARVALLPEIDLPNIEEIKIKAEKAEVKNGQIEKALKNLARSRATEKLVDREASSQDLVRLDYEIGLEGVPQEDGQQKDFAAYLGEKHMVPGFEENVIGLKAGETKEFKIKFPNDYFQKNYAGKTCEFKVKVNGVYELQIPAVDDDFAQSLGQFKSLAELKKQLADNLRLEEEYAADKKNERAILAELIKKSKFTELPERMIENEVETILDEIKHDLAQRNLQFEAWLNNMNKNIEQFKKDLWPQATERAKAALIVHQISQREKINVAEEEIDDEIDKVIKSYPGDEETKKQIRSAHYREHLKNILASQKAIDWLKEKILTD